MYEPTSDESVVGKLAEILRTPFEGDFLDAITTFERKVMIYEAHSRETISDSLKIGCVIAGMGQSSVREHLLLSATKCDSWSKFVRQVESIEHAKKIVSAPTPMEIDSFQGKTATSAENTDTLPKSVGVRAEGGAEKPQCAQCGKRHHGQCWPRSYTSSHKDSQKGWKGDRKGIGKGTQRSGKSKRRKGGTQGKGKGKGKNRTTSQRNHRTSRRTQWISGCWAQWSDQSWQTGAGSGSWREADDWCTAESSSQASAAAEEFQHASFGELRLSKFGVANYIDSFQLDRPDPSQRTITFGIDTAACTTVFLAQYPAARGY